MNTKVLVILIKGLLMYVLFSIGMNWNSRSDAEFDEYLSEIVLRYYTKEEILKDNIRVDHVKPVTFTNGFVVPQWETDNFIAWQGYPRNLYRGLLCVLLFVASDKIISYVYSLIKEENTSKKKGRKIPNK